MTVNYEELAQSFETCKIDASDFSHADHVGVTYEMLRRYDFLDASVRYSNSIKTIATNAGAVHSTEIQHHYHSAFLSLIAERIETSAHDSYEEFLEKNPDLFKGSVLTKWYSTDRMQSDLAREVFLMPDSVAA